MKRWLCLFLAAALLTGCTQPVELPAEEEPVAEVEIETVVEEETEEETYPENWSAELVALMETVNGEHQLIEKRLNYDERYLNLCDMRNEDFLEHLYSPEEPMDKEKSLPLEQAQEDVEVFFDGLHYGYALYKQYGDDPVFNKAKEKILTDLKAEQALTNGRLQEILIDNLYFIIDGHFAIGDTILNQREVPFFFREIEFQKDGKVYVAPDGRKVKEIEGFTRAELDELLKRSLNQEGEIVYYPVIMQWHTWKELKTGAINYDKTLTVQFYDGTTETLTAEPFQLYYDGNEDIITERVVDGVKIFDVKGFNISGGELTLKGLDYAEEAAAIVDLRNNGGGDPTEFYHWLKYYCGTTVTDNILWPDPDGTIYGLTEDIWAENDGLLIMLSSKRSSSGAEMAIDAGHNIENCLIIGENTHGCCTATAGNFTLPNSGLTVRFGASSILQSQTPGHFKELYGYEPDLWCPAWYAEEATINFIKKHIQ